jgi:hypothetical protein
MYASRTLTEAGERWRAAAGTLLDEAERIGPLEPGVFGDLGTDDEGEAVAQRIDAQVNALLEEGERAFSELQENSPGSIDARFQATSLLVGMLAVGDALAIAGEQPSDVFADLGVEPVETVTFTDARSTVDAAGAILTGAAPQAPPAVTVPASLATSLEDIESTGAKEVWAVASSSAGQLAGGALVGGLEGVLKGTAAAAFQAIRDQLSRWRDALKRGVVEIAAWVVNKLKSLLPERARDKVDDLVEEVQKKLEAGAGNLATDLFGRILGRPEAEKAWADAADARQDLTTAEGKLAGVVTVHKDRIEWVTKSRKIIEKFGDKVLAAVVAHLPGPAKLAYAALVAAVLGFVAFQAWDGFNGIKELVVVPS